MNREVEARIHQFLNGNCTKEQLADVLKDSGDYRQQITLLLRIDELLRRELSNWPSGGKEIARLKERLAGLEWGAASGEDLVADQEISAEKFDGALERTLKALKDAPFPKGFTERLLSTLNNAPETQNEAEHFQDDEALELEDQRDVGVSAQITSEDDHPSGIQAKQGKVVRMPLKQTSHTTAERDVLAAGTPEDPGETS